MKYLAICNECGKLLGETQEADPKELKENIGQVLKLASFSFDRCPRCDSDKIIVKKDPNSTDPTENN
jgi:DNA-directed RNA polymerase subunit RPC12/RpoP